MTNSAAETTLSPIVEAPRKSRRRVHSSGEIPKRPDAAAPPSSAANGAMPSKVLTPRRRRVPSGDDTHSSTGAAASLGAADGVVTSSVDSPRRRRVQNGPGNRKKRGAAATSSATGEQTKPASRMSPDGSQVVSDAHRLSAAVEIPGDHDVPEAHDAHVAGGGDQATVDAHRSGVPAESSSGDLRTRDSRSTSVAGGGDLKDRDAHASAVPADSLAIICDLYRVRRSLLQAEGDMGRRIKSKARSAATYRLRAQGEEPQPGKLPVPTEADHLAVARIYPSFLEALAVLARQRKAEEKALVAAVKPLPIMAWSVRGLGLLSIATLIGEAGDPARYGNPAKLWKRYGLAVIDGRSQRRVKDAEEAKRQGYEPSRRAALYVIGENLIRARNPYARILYDAAKGKELAKVDAEGKPITKGHAHKRALRIVQKRLVLAFWLAWRQMARGEPLSEVPRAFMDAEGAAAERTRLSNERHEVGSNPSSAAP